MLYWLLKRIMVGPWVQMVFRPWVEGAENVPERGAAILASNHLSFSDSIFLPLVLDRRITFPAKMEYFTDTGVKGAVKRFFFRGTGQVPIDRTGGKKSWAALEVGLEILRRGELFGIYPEGTRSPDGRLYKGKTGVARMALEAGVPVIPVAMIDTDKAQPTGQKIPNIVRVGIRFGKPLDFSRYAGMEEDHTVLRAITDEIMYELMQLSGQEYVDEYAANRKAVLAEKAEQLLAAAKAESAAAAAKAEEFVAAAKAETAARAENLVATARTESAAAAARAEEFVAAAKAETAARAENLVTTATARTESAAAKAEDFVATARARARQRSAAGTDAEGETEAPEAPASSDTAPTRPDEPAEAAEDRADEVEATSGAETAAPVIRPAAGEVPEAGGRDATR